MTSSKLDEWLDYIAQGKPTAIKLGLDRAREVWERLDIDRIAPKIVIVAGTNGKGSTVSLMEHMLTNAGFRVGSYTSPHISVYNERIRLCGQPVSDDLIIRGLQLVDKAKQQGTQDIELSYFEFATLGALATMAELNLEVALLEIGLGGRLDVVNIIDGDVSLITSVGLDHTEWLGNDREAIGYEKAGVLRPNRRALLGYDMPQSVLDYADNIGARVDRFGIDLNLSDGQFAGSAVACRLSDEASKALRWLPESNVALALELVSSFCPPGVFESTLDSLQDWALSGRMEVLHDSPLTFLDVGHNPQAAEHIKRCLDTLRSEGYMTIHAVFSALAEKDVSGVVQVLEQTIDHWWIAELQVERALPIDELSAQVSPYAKNVVLCSSVEKAFISAKEVCDQRSAIICFGSFFVVESLKSI